MDDGRIAEADVHRGRARHPVERPVERLEAIAARLLGPRLHIGLVDLHDVGAGGKQVLDLGIDGRRIVECQLLLVAVEIVLRLLRHRKGTGHRHLDHAVRVGAQELHVAHLDRMPATHLAGDARHRIGMAGAIERGAGIVDVDAVERGGETVGVALAPHLAVRDDVEARSLLVANGQQRRVVLRGVEEFGRDPPQLLRAHARRKASGELLAVDQPVGLGIGTHERGWKQRQWHQALPAFACCCARLIASTRATCRASRPVPSWIWCRHDVPSATMMASSGAWRTVGSSDSSPMASEASIVVAA